MEPEMIVKQVQQGLGVFADDMKAAGIHVGMGKPPRCVNCGHPWPCPSEEKVPTTEGRRA